jgi:hypothetical protein
MYQAERESCFLSPNARYFKSPNKINGVKSPSSVSSGITSDNSTGYPRSEFESCPFLKSLVEKKIGCQVVSFNFSIYLITSWCMYRLGVPFLYFMSTDLMTSIKLS